MLKTTRRRNGRRRIDALWWCFSLIMAIPYRMGRFARAGSLALALTIITTVKKIVCADFNT